MEWSSEIANSVKLNNKKLSHLLESDKNINNIFEDSLSFLKKHEVIFPDRINTPIFFNHLCLFYLTNSLGFSASTKKYSYGYVRNQILEKDCYILNPWELFEFLISISYLSTKFYDSIIDLGIGNANSFWMKIKFKNGIVIDSDGRDSKKNKLNHNKLYNEFDSFICSEDEINDFFSKSILSRLKRSSEKSINLDLQLNKTFIIGDQEWMSKNLDITRFRNGDIIPEMKTFEEWKQAGDRGQPAWCHYDNNPANSEKYGKLYNWYAVNDSRGLAPEGFHIPSDEEFNKLIYYLEERTKIASRETTNCYNENKFQNNKIGFEGLPGGIRNWISNFSSIGKFGYWWSSTSINVEGLKSWYRSLDFRNGKTSRYFGSNDEGLSVRCLRN